MQKTTRFNLTYLIIAVMGVFVIHDLWVGYQSVTPLAYSEFQKLISDDKIKEIVITEGETRGELKEPQPPNKKYSKTTRVDSSLADALAKHDVKFSGQVESRLFSTLLSWILPVLIFFGIWMLLMRRVSGQLGAGGGLMSIGKSKAKVYVETDTKRTFADVAGVEEAKAELKETVDFLKDPKSYGRLGARMPKGILPVHKVSIIPRGIGALGYTIQRPTEDRYPRLFKSVKPAVATSTPAVAPFAKRVAGAVAEVGSVMRGVSLGVVLPLVLIGSPALAGVEADVEASVVFAGRNDARIPGNGGTKLSLVNDLSTSPAPAFRLRLGYRIADRHLITALYAPLQLNARGSVDRDVAFAGGTYPAGSPLLAVYRFDSYRLTYRYSIVWAEGLDVAAGVTAKIRDAETSLYGVEARRKTNTGFVPLLNVHVAWRPGNGSFGMVLDADALAAPQGRAEDVLLAVTWAFRQGLELRVGYRMVEGGADNDEVYSFAWFHSVVAGLGMSF